jgi:D-alanyl-D-alanine carboxypeptidase
MFRSRNFRRVIVAAVSLTFARAPLAIETRGQTATGSGLAGKIDSIVESEMKTGSIPGLSLAVEKDGKIVTLKGYGYSDLENDVPAAPETVYQIASISKQFTAAALLQLVERGRVHLDDDLNRYFPDYITHGRHVTIHNLLTHTHGFREYNRPETVKDFGGPLTHDGFLALMKDQPFEFPVGERFQYRNTGYYLAAMIIEQISGKSYGDYLRESIFKPLEMTSTCDCGNKPLIKHRAQGYALEGTTLVNKALLDMTWPFGVGSLCSNVSDLLKWEHALYEGKVISGELYSRMIQPATLNDGSKTKYGYGLEILDVAGHRIFSHGGSTLGYTSYMAYYPDDRLTIIILTNVQGQEPRSMERKIASLVLGTGEDTGKRDE